MKRILVLSPHEDRAHRAITLAASLAARTGASLTLLRVLEEVAGTDAPLGGESRSIRDILTEVETGRVGDEADRLRAAGLDVKVEVCWGVPWEVVLDLVRRDGYDLCVKPATGQSHAGQVFFGSTALFLFRRCPCPVWVVGDDGGLPSRVLAAVDPTTSGRGVANRIVDWAEQVAGWSGGAAHVATAWHARAAELLKDDLSATDWKSYVDDARDRAERDLGALLSERESPTPSERVHLLEGTPQEALPRFAEERDVDLIVMGTLGRKGGVGDLLGETAETVIRQVRSSVLTIPLVTEA